MPGRPRVGRARAAQQPRVTLQRRWGALARSLSSPAKRASTYGSAQASGRTSTTSGVRGSMPRPCDGNGPPRLAPDPGGGPVGGQRRLPRRVGGEHGHGLGVVEPQQPQLQLDPADAARRRAEQREHQHDVDRPVLSQLPGERPERHRQRPGRSRPDRAPWCVPVEEEGAGGDGGAAVPYAALNPPTYTRRCQVGGSSPPRLRQHAAACAAGARATSFGGETST
jgi:hypothetical protein